MYQYPVYPQQRVFVTRDYSYHDGGGEDYWAIRASEAETMKVSIKRLDRRTIQTLSLIRKLQRKKMVYEATDKKKTDPDWELNMRIVDIINSSPFGNEVC